MPESLNAFWDGEEGTDTRLALLARKVPPDVMMRPADVSFDPGRGDWGSGILHRSSIVPVPVLIQDSIVQLYTPFFNGSWGQLSTPCPRMNWHGAA